MSFAPREAEQFWHQCALVTILVVATCARFYSLDQASLSADELINLVMCEINGWWTMATENQSRSGMTPFYPTAMCFITGLTSNTEFVARSLSALAGLAAIYFIYITGRDFISPTAGLLAAAIVATEYQAIYLNRAATLYSLLTLLCLIHNYCFFRLFFSANRHSGDTLDVRHHSATKDFRLSWKPDFPANPYCLIGFWISGALAFYTNPMALIQLLSEVLASAFLIKKAAHIFPDWRAAMRSLWLPLLIILLPWLPIFYQYRFWILEGNLFGFQSPLTLWQRIHEVLPVSSIALNVSIALSVLLVIFITVVRLLKKETLFSLSPIYFVVFQFGIAAISLWLILPASQLSYFYYWWIFVLLLVMPVSFGMDLISLPHAKKYTLITMLVVIVIFQVYSNDRLNLYKRVTGGDFRLAAQIIRDDRDFMSANKTVYISSDLFSYYLNAYNITGSNSHIINMAHPIGALNYTLKNSEFYYLEYMPYDRNLNNETKLFRALVSQHKTLCMTKMPWIRIVKFSLDAPTPSTPNPLQDCRSNLSEPVFTP